MEQKKANLIVATRNPGKLREIEECLKDFSFNVEGLNDHKEIGEIVEDGPTFEDNALKKAQTVHRQLGGFVLADDSGLACEDLNGRPGVQSARYAGPEASDDENNQALIKELMEVDDPSRRAQYVCVLVLIDPDGKETIVRESCDGIITFKPGGTGGFGYDPYFFLPDRNCTMAELPLNEKNKISHRGKALKKLHEILLRGN